jgi:glutamate-5-semialdehyde dehydrogenase
LADAVTSLERACREARAAGRILPRLSAHEKAVALREMADAIERRADEILRENEQDVAQARRERLAPAAVDALLLDRDRIAEMAAGVRSVAALPDPVGQVDHGWRMVNGLRITRVRVPFGVIAVVYEGRPTVTADAAALCLASGNAVVLHGSRAARRSDRILAGAMAGALIEAGVPQAAISIAGPGRDELLELIRLEHLVDLVILRGGGEVAATVVERSRIPVIAASSGNNHVYVDASADVEMAVKIAVNAKVQRPGVASAAETLLVHRDAAPAFLPGAVEALRAQGVEVRLSPDGLDMLDGDVPRGVVAATEADYATEFLSLTIAVRVVDSLEAAVEHIDRYGSGHSEAIVTGSLAAASEFQETVDAACVYVNASTRFSDGGEFGMGAEIASSTQKLHARGPIGLTELTTIKYLVSGDGQVR